jgi:hypothetical protein
MGRTSTKKNITMTINKTNNSLSITLKEDIMGKTSKIKTLKTL